jgi:hypothetical protein
MGKPPWLDEVLRRLQRHALPTNYVKRFVDELSDHLEDLKEETMGTEADVSLRLGKPEQVANAAVAAFRRRSFLGRHPTAAFLVFAVSPVVLFVALALICFLALVAVQGIFGFPGQYDETHFGRVALAAFACFFNVVMIAIPAVLASAFYCELANGLGLGAVDCS